MALRTILVHLANDPDHRVRMEVAKSLARAHGAYLIALYITRPGYSMQYLAGRGVSRVFLEEAKASAERHAEELEGEFTDYCERKNIPHEWIVADGEHLDLLAEHAHAADLVVVTRPSDRNLEDRVRLRLAEELVLNTGLPILVLPPGFKDDWVPRRVLIAWKPTREAVRAVRDALPLLEKAQEVIVGTVRPSSADAISTMQINHYLDRQGIESKTIDMEEQGSTGETILAMASAHGCDLVVAGAYGHSRLREVFVGGFTRTVMRHTEVPLLLSH